MIVGLTYVTSPPLSRCGEELRRSADLVSGLNRDSVVSVDQDALEPDATKYDRMAN